MLTISGGRSRRRVRSTIFLAALAWALATVLAPAAGAAKPQGEPAPFGHACSAQDGVRFCPTATLEERVPSFDGVPLDADVTLPASGSGPFPTIVMMHGWGGSKSDFESSSPAGDGNETFDYNNVYYAQHGFAVLNYSARGWGRSCGTQESRTEPGCKEGWIRLADQRYEARDTQYLLGLLADEKLAKPKSIGVTGISYGGGQSIELAYLKNRVRLPDGEFEAWKSPAGRPMEVKAAFPRWPWSDLIDALQPNGRFLDGEVAPPGESYEPIGVEIQSYVAGLFALGQTSGFIAPPEADPEADLTKWFARVNAGEPVTADAEEIAHQIYDFHQGYGIPTSGPPAPMLLESGWTDDLFPPSQSLRVYNASRAQKGYAALLFGDLGHSRGSNKQNTDVDFNEKAAAFFTARLEHKGKAPKNGSVTAYTQTCPQEAPAEGPFTAKSWAKLPDGRGDVRLGGAADVHLGRGQPGDGRGVRPDRRHQRRVQDGERRRRAGHGQLHDDEQRLHTAGAAEGAGDDRHDGPVRRDRRAAVGRTARRRTAARQPWRLSAARQPERHDHVPAPRQRLPLRRRRHGEAAAAGP